MLSRIRQALQWLSFLLFISQLICNTSFADVGTAARYGPPFLRKSMKTINNWSPCLINFFAEFGTYLCIKFYRDPMFMYSDNVLWKWPDSVSFEQFIRGGWRWDMGQWGILREAVPGEMHKRLGARNLWTWADYSNQDRWLRSSIGIYTVCFRHDHCFVRNCLQDYCQFNCHSDQRRISTVNYLHS